MTSLRDSLINLMLPGTDVPGYRLFRPCGTGFVAVSKVPSNRQRAPGKEAVGVDSSHQGF